MTCWYGRSLYYFSCWYHLPPGASHAARLSNRGGVCHQAKPRQTGVNQTFCWVEDDQRMWRNRLLRTAFTISTCPRTILLQRRECKLTAGDGGTMRLLPLLENLRASRQGKFRCLPARRSSPVPSTSTVPSGTPPPGRSIWRRDNC